MSFVIGLLANVLPLLLYVLSKWKWLEFLTAASGKAGLFAKVCGLLVSAYWFIRRLPITFLKIKLGTGVLGKIFGSFRWILNMFFHFPVLMVFTLVVSQIFPSLLERVFLVVGALALKIGIMIFSKVMSAMEDSSNTEMLNSIIGDSLNNMPPCLVDVLGYMHIVEDIGLIISTAVVIMTYNIVTAFAFKFVR